MYRDSHHEIEFLGAQSMSVQPIPAGFHAITPYLIIDGAAAAMDFYTNVFGATEDFRMEGPGGKIGHAEMVIGDSKIMLADENPEMGIRGPETIGGTPVSLLLYVENVDEVFERVIAAGATELRPLVDQFYGDRSGAVTDPFGHTWSIATHVEDIPPDEMMKRAQQAMQQGGCGGDE